jgi:putative dimethyl sulfoxide reductase chaperone
LSSSAIQADLVRRAEVIEAEEGAALSQVARQRSQTYWWLSELFLGAPDRARIAGIVREAREAADPESDLPLKDFLDELVLALEQSDADTLAVEHARLFAGLGASYGAIPPYESLHVGNEPREDRVTNVTAAYRDAGFERIDVPAVPQDHLAVELRFMALLAANESEAWSGFAAEEARSLLVREQSFLGGHLQFWVPTYCERMATETRLPFFGALARMTAAALALDRQNVDAMLRATASV